MIIVVERESSIQINLSEPIGKVNPFVLGQFIEHFPRQIYGGFMKRDPLILIQMVIAWI